MPKCDFNNFIEIALRHECSPVNLLHISEHLWMAASDNRNHKGKYATCNLYIFSPSQKFLCTASLFPLIMQKHGREMSCLICYKLIEVKLQNL